MHELLARSDKVGIYNICFRRLTARPYLQILGVKLGKLSRGIPAGGRHKFVDPVTKSERIFHQSMHLTATTKRILLIIKVVTSNQLFNKF